MNTQNTLRKNKELSDSYHQKMCLKIPEMIQDIVKKEDNKEKSLGIFPYEQGKRFYSKKIIVYYKNFDLAVELPKYFEKFGYMKGWNRSFKKTKV